MLRAVIFDLDDTLYNYTKGDQLAKAALANYCTEHKLMTPAEMFDLHSLMLKKQAALLGECAASHNRLIRYQLMLEEAKLPVFPHALNMAKLYWNTLFDAAVPEEGIVKFLQALRDAGMKIGIGTNMTAFIQFEKLERLGLAPYVDFITTSEDAGVEKPSPAFFLTCAKKAGFSPEECLFIGDSLKHDVCGAMNVGMKAVLYCPDYKDHGQILPSNLSVIHHYQDALTDILLSDNKKLFI